MQCHMVYGNDAKRIERACSMIIINWMIERNWIEQQQQHQSKIDRQSDLVRQFAWWTCIVLQQKLDEERWRNSVARKSSAFSKVLLKHYLLCEFIFGSVLFWNRFHSLHFSIYLNIIRCYGNRESKCFSALFVSLLFFCQCHCLDDGQ